MSKYLLSIFLLINPVFLYADNECNSDRSNTSVDQEINNAIFSIHAKLDDLRLNSLACYELDQIKAQEEEIMNHFYRTFERNVILLLEPLQNLLFNKCLDYMMTKDDLTSREKLTLCYTLKLNYLRTKMASAEDEKQCLSIKTFEEKSLSHLDQYIQDLEKEVAEFANQENSNSQEELIDAQEENFDEEL